MKFLLCALCLCFAHVGLAQETILIDAMTDPQVTAAGEVNWVLGSNVLGGEREISNLGNIFQIEIEEGLFSGTVEVFNSLRMVYDGQDEDADNIDYFGLDGLDLSSMEVFRISALQPLFAAISVNVTLFSDETNASGVTRGYSSHLGIPLDIRIPFSDFLVVSGDGVDLSRVGALVISFQAQFGQVRLLMDEIAFETAFIPVELSSFNALVDDNDIHLTWRTESELNNAGFEVQHAHIEEGLYETIAYISGHGTTLDPKQYEHTMYGAGPGTHFFRLKQIDFDGTFAIHDTREVRVLSHETHTLSDAYPNPFNPQTNFNLTVSMGQRVRVDLFDMLGRHQKQVFDGFLDSGTLHQFDIDGSSLSSGTYLYRVEGEHFRETRRVILSK